MPRGHRAVPLSQRLVCTAAQPPEPPARKDTLRRVALVAAALMVLAAGGIWLGHRALLTAVGNLIVHEDQVALVDAIVVSNASAVGDAMEAVRLRREGVGAHIVLFTESADPFDEEVRRLGVPMLGSTDLARSILERAGVPATEIEVLPSPADGTSAEIAMVAAFARQRHPASLMYITARSHTGRAHWLLRRQLPQQTQVIVRSPRVDTFAAEAWWQSRKESREVLEEYLRWGNSVILRDPWGEASE